MKRRLFNFLTLLSLALCVAVTGLWARSHWRMDEVRRAARGGRLLRVLSAHGRVQVLAWDDWPCEEPLRWRTAEPRLFPDLPPITSLPGDPRLVITVGDERGRGVYRTFYDPGGAAPPAGRWDAFDDRTFRVTPRSAYRHDTFQHRTVVLWLLALPAAWLVERGVRAAARERRARLGLCAACGYDLTGNESGACPECGTPVGTSGP